MRICLTLACPQALPFDHLPNLVAAFHQWTGNQAALHDGLSLYSLSWLAGGRREGNQLVFKKGARWTISAQDPALAATLLASLVEKPQLPSYNMHVLEAQLIGAPRFEDGQHRFELLSPVLVKAPSEKGVIPTHLRFDQAESAEVLTQTLHKKLRAAGLETAGAAVAFDAGTPGARDRIMHYKGIKSRVNECPVIVTGTAEQQRFAWLVGVGHSTGTGCGALR